MYAIKKTDITKILFTFRVSKWINVIKKLQKGDEISLSFLILHYSELN